MKKVLFLLAISHSIVATIFGQQAVVDVGANSQLNSLNSTAFAQYTEAINTVAALNEQIKQMKEQMNQTKAMKEQLGEGLEVIKTAYNNTFGIVGELHEVYKEIVKTPEYFEDLMKQYKDIIDCGIEDLSSYQRAEKMLEAKYVFNKKKEEGDQEVDAGDFFSGRYNNRYEGKYYSAGVDSFEALNQDPCAFSLSEYDRLERKAEEEKDVILKIMEKNTLSKEEADQRLEQMENLVKKIQTPGDQKETADTSMQIQHMMLLELKAIRDILGDLVLLQYTNEYEATMERLQSTPRLTQAQIMEDRNSGIKYNKANRLSQKLKTISRDRQKSLIPTDPTGMN